MKKLHKNIIKLGLLSFAILFIGCNNNSNDFNSGGTYTISKQTDVANFNATGDIYSLTISGTDITDISTLQFKTVKNLVINNTGIAVLNLPHLNSITQSLQIEGNSKLTAISKLDSLKFINGSVTIDNNTLLTDISTLKKLKVFIGKLTISNNSSLGVDIPNAGDYTYGLYPVKYLTENSILNGTVVLVNNHPKAATDVSLIGNMNAGSVLNYTINSAADAQNFVAKNDTVNNITIKGMDISDDVFRSLATKFKVVRGTISIQNTSITTTEGFFDVVKCQGGILILDNLSGGGLFNLNGLKAYTSIGGDLIINNCPGAVHWGPGNSLSQITNIVGSVRIIGGQMTNQALWSLKTVGGDFEIRNNNVIDFWNLSGCALQTIGGNFIYTDNHKVNGLGGLEKITSIGGNVTIGRNGSTDVSIGEIPLQSLTGRPGFCLIKGWVQKGVISSTATITLTNLTDVAIDFSTLTTCQ